jgi:hypothetical protein
MEKWFSGREFVAARDAKRHFGFVRIVIAGSVTAVMLAARTLDVCNVAPRTAATNEARRAGSIIATGNVSTGNGTRRHA